MKRIRFVWLILACVLFFVVGWVIGGHQAAFINPGAKNTPNQIASNLTFNLPQVPLPSGWKSKENQPGNSFATAFQLSPGITTQGTINNDNVIDFYYFDIKDPSQVVIDVTDVPKSLYWIIYDSNYNQIASAYRSGTIKGSTQVALSNPGKYYLKVWADYQQTTNFPYTVRLSILPYFE